MTGILMERQNFMRTTTCGRAATGLAILVLGCWGTVLRASEPTLVEPRKPQIPKLKVEKYTLPNGLTVILHEDHKTPVVAVNMLLQGRLEG